MNDIPPELESWSHPMPSRMNIIHCCENCKYDSVPETESPCVDCIHNMDIRKDLWELKGGKNE